MTVLVFKSHSPIIGARVYIADSAVVVGKVQIGDDSSIWPGTVIRGDVNTIDIGRGCSIQDNSVIHVTHVGGPSYPKGFSTVIGDYVTVGHRVILHGCHILGNALIGMGAIVMDGAIIEHNVLVGAGSLVPPGKLLAGGHLYVGSPVKPIRRLSTQEIESIQYSATHYLRLKNQYLLQ